MARKREFLDEVLARRLSNEQKLSKKASARSMSAILSGINETIEFETQNEFDPLTSIFEKIYEKDYHDEFLRQMVFIYEQVIKSF